MNSVSSALLALLLVCSLPAMTLVGAAFPGGDDVDRDPSLQQAAVQQESQSDASNTTNRLRLDGTARNVHAEYSHDIGTALAATDDELRVDQEQHALVDDGFDEAPVDERADRIEAGYNHFLNRTDALAARERTAVEAHAAGDRSTAELIHMLLRTKYEAAAIANAFGQLSDRADRTTGYSLPVQDEQSELMMYETDIRSELARAGRGERTDALTLGIQTTANGYVLEMVDGEYVREATRFDHRDTSQQNQFGDILSAYERAGDLYPWVFETGQSPTINEHTTVQLYRVSGLHDQGTFELYLDGGTGEVHRETQELSVASLPQLGSNQWTTDELEVTLTRTPEDGPAKLTVVDMASGEPQSATVTIDGVEIGTTGADGTLWVVPPDDGSEVTVETSTGTLTTTIGE